MRSQRAVSARRARTADATAAIHLAILTLAKLILGVVGLVLSALYKSPPALAGSVVADALALAFLLAILVGYRKHRRRMHAVYQAIGLLFLALTQVGAAIPGVLLPS